MGIGLTELLTFLFGIVVYFTPTAIAFHRQHKNAIGIMLLNTLAGWLFLPWIASLIWSLRR